jgi:hypothetical protein
MLSHRRTTGSTFAILRGELCAVSFGSADAAGCHGPEAANPNARTLEPSASAIARPAGLNRASGSNCTHVKVGSSSHWIVNAIWDPSGDQYGELPPTITFVKSEPSGAKV